MSTNDNLLLISGESSTGKSASLKDMRDQEGVLYLNCEAGKKLPFKNKFQSHTITDPYQIFEAFNYAAGKGAGTIHTIGLDTLTFLMDMYESVHVVPATNTMKAWGNYNQFFKELMQQYVANSTVNVIFMGHTLSKLNEQTGIIETSVPVKGALKNQGAEAYFSTVVSTKKVPLRILESYQNDMLNITEDDQLVGYKHVFQTRLTKETVGERIRSPMGLFTRDQTFIDNNAQALLDHLHKYYA
ncbi:gp073 [Erwinia phage vB_EamP-S6]|uniref:Gp073 n=1 Tax=Erwinia phage vB_EamP-S6 TaxID=1051675 RepID=G0YQG5_9CAUD|nr:gp073 [Erwinia phage vB_EamP-S6]AEJ81592.1 gp073 [Erwinia phage vB_EamP-S6]